MWDSPAKLNRVSDALMALAALLVLAVLVRYAIHHPLFAVRALTLSGDTARIYRDDVQGIVRHGVGGTFFTIDIERMREAFEKLPWVRRADVRRQWPNGLEVVIESHKVLARWGKDQLVNREGEVFSARYEGKLPQFAGPEGSAAEVTAYYARLTDAFASVGREPVEVLLSPRRAWLVRLDDGMRLELGRNEVDARLKRFIAAYPAAIVPLKRRIDYVDLRYANGFAVRVPGITDLPQKPGA